MELLFLGTGAADWEISNRNGFFRRNSAALLDGSLMLDCGEHIFDFVECEGDCGLYERVSDVIITHDHSDHYCPESVRKLAESRKIRVGCDKAVANKIGEHPNIEFVMFKPFEKYSMGGFEITPVLANHDIVANGDNFSFHFIVENSEGKKLFYGLDGAWLLRPTWEEMKKHKFDIMVFDCTVGDFADWRLFEHNTIPMLRHMMKEVNEKSLVAEGGVLIASHLARTLHVSHEETAAILKELGMVTAYDGMKIVL